jgi:hypothetical protein
LIIAPAFAASALVSVSGCALASFAHRHPLGNGVRATRAGDHQGAVRRDQPPPTAQFARRDEADIGDGGRKGEHRLLGAELRQE